MHKTIRLVVASGLLLGALLACNAMAQSDTEAAYTLHNLTEGHIVIGFYTHDGNCWSTNWLKEQMMSGQTVSAAFFEQTGACDQLFQVSWLGTDGSEVMDEPVSIDICQATNVYLGDNKIYFD